MTRNKSKDSLKPIGGGTGGRSFSGGAKTLGALTNVTISGLNGLPAAGDALFYDGLKWVNGQQDARISHWSSTNEYFDGAVVLHRGELWLCRIRHKNIEPQTDPAHWALLTDEVPTWRPNTPYIQGTIVKVPFNSDYWTTFDVNTLYQGTPTGYSLWIAEADITGTIPVGTGEAVSISAVPPGNFAVADMDVTTGPGNVTGYDAWQPITPPVTFFVSDISGLQGNQLRHAIVPRSHAIITGGAEAGEVFVYNAHPIVTLGDPARNAVSQRGWVHAFTLPGGGTSSITGSPQPNQLSIDQSVIWAPNNDANAASVPHLGFVKPGPTTPFEEVFFWHVTKVDFDANGAGEIQEVVGVPTPTAPDGAANKHYVDAAVAPLVAGIEHGAAVESIINDPPGFPSEGDLHIVGTAPTGVFVGHANAVAFYDQGAWVFTAPNNNEAHLNEADNTIYHWNGTAWNKIGTTGTSVLDDLTDVDTTTSAPTTGQILTYDGTTWAPASPAVPTPSVRPISIPTSATAGNNLVIDFGSTDWTEAEVDLIVEAHLSDDYLRFALKASDGGWSGNGSTLQSAYVMGRYGNTNYSYNTTSVAQVGDWYHITYANNDADWAVHGSTSHVNIKLIRLPDGWLSGVSSIHYSAKNNTIAEVKTSWLWNNSQPNQNIQMVNINGGRMGLGCAGRIIVAR